MINLNRRLATSQVSYRKVGGLHPRTVIRGLGRLTFMFCLSKQHKSLRNAGLTAHSGE